MCCLRRNKKDKNLQIESEQNHQGLDMHRILSTSTTNTINTSAYYSPNENTRQIEMGQIVIQPSFPFSLPVHSAYSPHSPNSHHSHQSHHSHFSFGSPASVQNVVTPISLQPVSYPRISNQNNVYQQQRDVHAQSAINSTLSTNMIFTLENTSITPRPVIDGNTSGAQHDVYAQSQFPYTDEMDMAEPDPDDELYGDGTDQQHYNKPNVTTTQTAGDELDVTPIAKFQSEQ